TYGVLDPSAFKEDGGPSIGERINQRLVAKNRAPFRGADNARVPQKGAMGGWDQMRQRLVGDGDRPMLFYFSTCRDSIRTIPAMQHDADRPEDIDTNTEDHAADDSRYACMSRPWAKSQPREEKQNRSGYALYQQRADTDDWRTAL
ncbi:MAG: terminase, partial [Hyphomicrobiaceae bacterium]